MVSTVRVVARASPACDIRPPAAREMLRHPPGSIGTTAPAHAKCTTTTAHPPRGGLAKPGVSPRQPGSRRSTNISAFHHLGRTTAAVIVSALISLGILNAGLADAQPLNRPQVAKLAVTSQVTLQAHAAEYQRRHLRQVAKRACASHERALCTKTRAQLARLGAGVGSANTARRRIRRQTAAPTSGASAGALSSSIPASTGSSPGSSGSSSGSGGSGPSSPDSSGGSGGSSTSLPAVPNPIVESPTPNPVAESPAPTTTFQPGIDSGMNMTLDLQGSEQVGAKLVRIEFPIATTTPAEMESVIGGYAAKGIRVLVLATFRGTLPTPEQAQSLAGWAKMFGPGGTFWATHTGGQVAVQSIEFGNETSYGYQYGDSAGTSSYQERAENYARRLKEAAEAISATGIPVGLLAVADDWTGDWMNGMFVAVPNLSKYVAGWTIHPYHHWRSRMEDLLAQTAAHGDTTIPIDVTEFGLPADNGRCIGEDDEYNGCMPYSEAASILRSTVSEMRQMLGSRLGMLILYQIRDQEPTGASTNDELYYGALQHELQPKGEYTTAVKELLASS
jgi:hypothetical protein